MRKITKVPAQDKEGFFYVCIDGKSIGYPLTEAAANSKIESLIKSSELKSAELEESAEFTG